MPWQNGLFEESLKAAGLSGLEAGTKLYISNLDGGVSNEDIRVLILQLYNLTFHLSLNGSFWKFAEEDLRHRSCFPRLES